MTDDQTPDGDSIVRSEEEIDVSTRARELGSVRARKTVEVERAERIVPLEYEEAHVETRPATAGDTGVIEESEDGTISIPVFEEQLVVTKRLVVKERLIVRKRTVVEEQHVEADLRRERVEIDVDPEVADLVEVDDPPVD